MSKKTKSKAATSNAAPVEESKKTMKVRITLLGELGEAEALAIVKGYESEVEEHGQITLEGPLDIDTVDADAYRLAFGDGRVPPDELAVIPSPHLRVLIRDLSAELLRRAPPAPPVQQLVPELLQPVPATHAWDRRPITKPSPIASDTKPVQPTPASHSWDHRPAKDASGPIPEPEHALPTADELVDIEHDDGPSGLTTT